MSDQLLMSRIAAGDSEAVSVLVDTYSRRLFTYLLGLVRDREEARDLVQETLIRGCEKAATYTGKAPLTAWLFTVARNIHIDRFRAKNMKVHLNGVEMSESPLRHPSDRDSDSPEAVAQRHEVLERIGKAIEELPERQQDVARLRLLGELSLEEIAEVAGLSLGGVKSTLHNALQALRPKLADLK